MESGCINPHVVEIRFDCRPVIDHARRRLCGRSFRNRSFVSTLFIFWLHNHSFIAGTILAIFFFDACLSHSFASALIRCFGGPIYRPIG